MSARSLQRRFIDAAKLARLDKPIGIGLLLWPLLWALWIATDGHPPLKIFLIFFAGTLVMRSAGCVINDFADRNIDPFVKRTQDRPLAARRLSPQEALGIFFALLVVALWLVLQLDWLTVAWSVGGAVLTATYPFMKRFFPLPQLYLGAAFGWAIPMAFVATTGGVPPLGWLIFAVTVLWAGVYDTVYAMVDRDDDLKLDVHSTAILFGRNDRLIVGILQGLVLGGLVATGLMAGLRWPYWIALGIGAALFVYQQWLIRNREREACFKAFLNNNWFGLVVFAGISVA